MTVSASDEFTGDGEGICTGAACADAATQVPSLLQKARSQVGSAVVSEEEDVSEETAADLVMQELEQLATEHEQEVKQTLALNRQNLMLEEDEVAARRVNKIDAVSDRARAGSETNSCIEQ